MTEPTPANKVDNKKWADDPGISSEEIQAYKRMEYGKVTFNSDYQFGLYVGKQVKAAVAEVLDEIEESAYSTDRCWKKIEDIRRRYGIGKGEK